MAALLYLRQHRLGPADGRGEADSDAALRPVNRRVDADDGAVRIEQWPATIARVDGGVGLDHVLQLLALPLNATVERADYSRGQRAFEAEGIADGQDLLSHHQRVRVAQRERSEEHTS